MNEPEKTASLAPADVARRLGVGAGKVLGWIRRGQLRAIDVASEPGPGKRHRWRVYLEDLAAFEEQRATGHLPAPPAPPTIRRKPTRSTEDFLS